MELVKRDCPITMVVSPRGYGWVDLTLEINGDKYEIDVSDCLGSGIGGFLFKRCISSIVEKGPHQTEIM